MKKNSQIHLFLETDLKEKLEKQAWERELSVSEWCRIKLRENSQLTKVEILLENLIKKLNK